MKNSLKFNNEIIRYLIVGIFTTAVCFSTYFFSITFVLNSERLFDIQVANVISWISAVLFSYYANKRFVFKCKDSDDSYKILLFFTTRLLGLLEEVFITILMIESYQIDYGMTKVISQFVVVISNYLFTKHTIFKKH